MLRAIAALLIAVLFLIILLPYLGIVCLLQRKHPSLGKKTMFRLVQAGLRMVKAPCGIRLDVIGKEKIPQDRPVLFVGNHQSYFDVILVYPCLPPVTGFIAKNDFEKVPIFPIWMRHLYCQFLVKDDIRQNMKSIMNAIESMKQGASMCIFPEGTRNKGDERELAEFHEGSFKLATKTGAPIVPFAVAGSRKIWEAQFPKVKRGDRKSVV